MPCGAGYEDEAKTDARDRRASMSATSVGGQGRRWKNAVLAAKCSAGEAAQCPLLALSGHQLVHCTCLLSGVKRPSELVTKDAFRSELALKG